VYSAIKGPALFRMPKHNRRMKKAKAIACILAALIVLFLVTLLLYLLGAFAEMELHVNKWGALTRLIIAVADLYYLVKITTIAIDKYQNDD